MKLGKSISPQTLSWSRAGAWARSGACLGRLGARAEAGAGAEAKPGAEAAGPGARATLAVPCTPSENQGEFGPNKSANKCKKT